MRNDVQGKDKEVLEFRSAILVDIQNAFAVSGKTGEDAFAEHVSAVLEDSEMVDDYTPVIDQPSGRVRYHLNGYSFSPVDGFMNLFVARFDGDEDPLKLGVAEVRKEVESVVRFVKDRASLAAEASEAADYLDCIETIDSHCGNDEGSIRRFRISLFTDGIVTDAARRLSVGDIEGRPVDVVVYDIRALYALSVDDVGRTTLQIDFSKYAPLLVRCAPAGETDEDGRFRYASYIGVMPGIVLADIYDEFGSRLLEGNVRSFLSTKVTVNKKIRETILRAPEQFFAFNNGISVTASNVRFDGDNLAYAEEFQIINGGQTTASISSARFCDRADLSKIFVLMKLTVTKEGMSEDDKQELLKTISRASNMQNKVSDADFFSTHPFHVQIEKIAEITPAPAITASRLKTYWFYERARGQYAQKQMKLSRAKKDEFKKIYPPSQKITKTDFAKFRFSWEEKPYSVSKGAQTNFQSFAQEISSVWEKGESERARYNVQYFKDTVALAVMFKAVEEIVSGQSWYTGSFRANIVTYSISLLHHLLDEQYDGSSLNLDMIWRRQALPPVLVKVFRKIGKLVYEEIINTRTGVKNFTQRCKQKTFWEEMKGVVSVDLSSFEGFEDVLVSPEETKKNDARACIVGKLFSGVELQRKVMEKGREFWAGVQDFAMTHRKIGILPKEQQALTTAIRGGVVADFACKNLQQLLRRCQENGFKGEL